MMWRIWEQLEYSSKKEITINSKNDRVSPKNNNSYSNNYSNINNYYSVQIQQSHATITTKPSRKEQLTASRNKLKFWCFVLMTKFIMRIGALERGLGRQQWQSLNRLSRIMTRITTRTSSDARTSLKLA